MKTCTCCGQTLPEPEIIAGIWFPGKKNLILKAVHRAGKNGISTERLIQIVWGNDSEGGPEDANNTIAVHVVQMNAVLKKRKLLIRSTAIGRADGGYVLRNLP